MGAEATSGYKCLPMIGITGARKRPEEPTTRIAAVMDRLEMGAECCGLVPNRDKILAALPHALGKCGCVPLVQNRINVFG